MREWWNEPIEPRWPCRTTLLVTHLGPKRSDGKPRSGYTQVVTQTWPAECEVILPAEVVDEDGPR